MLKHSIKSILSQTPLAAHLIDPPRHFPRKIELPHKIYVGTHHKTGTMWLQRIFHSFAIYHKLNIIAARHIDGETSFDIALDGHSKFPLMDHEVGYRGVHMIRDPRDLIVSACNYHQRSIERRLHIPREEFGGVSYQEKINSYRTLSDKLLFEMENSSRLNINDMRDWNYCNPRFFELKYEELIQDFQLLLFGKMFAFLELPGSVIPSALSIAYNGSLFSGNVGHRHVASGASGNWRRYFDVHHVDRFKALFGSVCEDLGYEVNQDWG